MGQRFVLQDVTGQGNGHGPALPDAPERPFVGIHAEPAKKLRAYRDELATMRSQLKGLGEFDTSSVMQTISSIAARLCEIRADVVEMHGEPATKFRTQQIDPLRKDLELQYEVHTSRRVSLEFEWRQMGGQM